jgi:osmotically-inducible protein OsmY
VRRLLLAGTVFLVTVAAVAGTLEDMDLRSNVEASIRGTASTENLHLKIQVENRVAIPDGPVRDLNQMDDVAMLAAKIPGIVAVDRSRLRLEFQGPEDVELAGRLARTLFSSPRYETASIKIAVDHGVVTLTGTIDNASWRTEIRKIVGAVEGVTDLVDRLLSPETPDARIQKALDNVFSARALPRFPGRVVIVVKDGDVALTGRVPKLHDKQRAETQAWAINGVRRVDNRLTLGSGQPVEVVHP